MNESNDAQTVAKEIAERFGEPGSRPQAQLERMAQLMGTEWMREVSERAQKDISAGTGAAKRSDGTPRTPGGAFFAAARETAFQLVQQGKMGRPDFYRTFCWREKTPRPPKPPPPPPAPRQPRARAQARPAARPAPGGRPAGASGGRPPGASGGRPGAIQAPAPRPAAAPRAPQVPQAEVYSVRRTPKT